MLTDVCIFGAQSSIADLVVVHQIEQVFAILKLWDPNTDWQAKLPPSVSGWLSKMNNEKEKESCEMFEAYFNQISN